MRFIKSKLQKVAYNRDYITYIRIDKIHGQDGRYSIVIGYAPCNDAYKEITLEKNLDINSAEQLYDKYLLELEEEPIQEILGDVVDRADYNYGYR